MQATDHLWIAQSRFWQTNSGLWLSEGAACLIDPGVYPDEIAALAKAAKCTGTRRAPTRRAGAQSACAPTIVLTHSHWDHILGPERLPGARVVAHAAFLACASGPEGAGEVDPWFVAQGIARERPFIAPWPDPVFEDELPLAIGRLSLRLIHAPGHTADQLVLYHGESATLWAADMLSDLEPPLLSCALAPYERVLAPYERTLARLAQLEVRLLVPGHGRPTADAREIAVRFDRDRAYLAELRERVGQAVREGRTMEETVALCAGMRYRRPEENTEAHHRNVRGVYRELAGDG